jgi:hypothetical protein
VAPDYTKGNKDDSGAITSGKRKLAIRLNCRSSSVVAIKIARK